MVRVRVTFKPRVWLGLRVGLGTLIVCKESTLSTAGCTLHCSAPVADGHRC